MNILFLTLSSFGSLGASGIYPDLLREFVKNGHFVCVISPIERRFGEKTQLIEEKNARILRLRTGNIQKTNVIEKGISTVLLEPQVKRAIRRYFGGMRFDLVLYTTPPITLVSAVEYAKKRDGAKSFLLLKDIFPQNAVDIGMMKTSGIGGLLYRSFKKKERRLYKASDFIGCMSEANRRYILEQEPYLDADRVGICPNSIEVTDKSVTEDERRAIREKYNIPLNKRVFVYGGNLGKPQDIPFVIRCIEAARSVENAFFLIVGNGTEFALLDSYAERAGNANFRLMQRLPKQDYDLLTGACDVGLIFLDHRFTIPNFPSRLLGYMQSRLPVLACTDPNTDVGEVIVKGGFGRWCESSDEADFVRAAAELAALESDELCEMGGRAFRCLEENYSAAQGFETIIRAITGAEA